MKTMKTLKLFNAVVSKPSHSKRHVSEKGYVIEAGALWAKDDILKFYENEALNGRDLNKTFHKAWKTIKETPRGELAIHQILHYLSTYGTNFEGDIYIPDEVVRVPGLKVTFKVVRALSKDALVKKALAMLSSGMALTTETIDDILTVLVDELGYTFTGEERIANKEAVVRIADLYGIIPTDFMGFFRYILFRSTGSTLVIKNGKTVAAIKASTYDPTLQFKKFGLAKLAEHFNRFKPLFLAYKAKCPQVINEISRLSKHKHKPMVTNPLNQVTQRQLTKADTHWLDNATPYAIFKALSALHQRMRGQTAFVYKVRNGKAYVKESYGGDVPKSNFAFLMDYLKGRIDLSGKRIFVPEDVVFSLPTSEKMYVGNIPMGTKFYGDKLAVGIYWENAWGAHDIDLSGLSADGKTGWNAAYGRGGDNDGLMYSGDITNAPNGAVEYLYAQRGIPGPTLVMSNVFSGEPENVKFKIIVGRGDSISRAYMMNPNNLFMEATVTAVERQSIIGVFFPEGRRQAFALVNFGAGRSRVSGYDDTSTLARVAMFQEWRSPLTFEYLVTELGAKLVKDPKKANVDLSLNKLEKDSFISLFSEKVKPVTTGFKKGEMAVAAATGRTAKRK